MFLLFFLCVYIIPDFYFKFRDFVTFFFKKGKAFDYLTRLDKKEKRIYNIYEDFGFGRIQK